MSRGGPILAHRLDDVGPGGSDEIVLLLNGGYMSIGAWEPIASLLAERHRVLRCDFMGQLRTPGPAHREFAPNADDVAALLDHLGLDRVHVFGTSFGGEVGLLFAARHPERVASLVAVTVGDYTTDAMREAAREMRRVFAEILAGGERGRFHDILVPKVYSGAYVAGHRELLAERRSQIERIPDPWFEAAADIVAAVGDFDLRPELGKIRCPTLVVVAAGDRAIPPERGRGVAAAIPGAELAEHPTSGHVLIHEDPEWLVARALDFFNRNSLSESPALAMQKEGRAGASLAPRRGERDRG